LRVVLSLQGDKLSSDDSELDGDALVCARTRLTGRALQRRHLSLQLGLPSLQMRFLAHCARQCGLLLGQLPGKGFNLLLQ
jgi:hypothetical protein